MNLKKLIKEKELELEQLKAQFNNSDPIERIKTFEDACNDQNINSNNSKFQYNQNKDSDNSGIAFERLKVIRNALLNNNSIKTVRYTPYFNKNKKPGSSFFNSCCHCWSAYSLVSSRLQLETSEKAIYFGKQFESEWYNYLIEH